MATFEEVMALAAPSEDTVPLVLGGQYLEQIRQLERQLAEAKPPSNLGERNPATVIAEQIAELQKTMGGTRVDFRLRSIGGEDWNLYRTLQPKALEKDETTAAFNKRFFDWMCGLVAATCYDPVMNGHQVAALSARMPGASWDELTDRAWSINAGKVSVPFSAAASAVTRNSETE